MWGRTTPCVRLESILEEELFALLTRANALERREADIGPRLQKRLPEFLTPDQTQAASDLVRDAIFGGD